jgi:AcrR family transcriptional regulator
MLRGVEMSATSAGSNRRSRSHESTTAGGDARRQLVLQEAVELFAQKGYENTTISDIARATGLRKPSLYHYFPSKQSIFLAVLSEGMDEIWANAREATQLDDLRERFSALFQAHLHNFRHRLPHVVVFLFEQRRLTSEIGDEPTAKTYMEQRRAYDHLFIDCIRQGQEAGIFRQGDPSVLAYGILGMANWMVQWYKPEGRLTTDDIGAILHECAVAAILESGQVG